MYIGAAYYPELWDESEIEKDVERCRSRGLNTLRIGEFAWSKMEPEEGRFDLDWLERVVDRLWAAGISTILCTPTCTPPRWMLNRYDEMRAMLPSGEREEVSSRGHRCKTSPLVREKNRRIVTELARRFGSHEGVIGWQIDNEIYTFGDGCYCPLCQAAFHDFLRHKYGSIEELNRRWGMSRWSLEYSSFDEVQPPKPGQWVHPSLKNLWIKFHFEQIHTYIDEQAEILHRYTKAPVGTDMMPLLGHNFYRTNKNLDLVMYNHYDQAERLPLTTFFYDFIRPIKERPFWVTETQAGWYGNTCSMGGWRPRGNCYANTWLPIAHGAEANLYWHYREHPNGHELAHGAIFTAAGRPYLASEDVARASEEMQRCDSFLKNSRVRARIALHVSADAEYNFQVAKIFDNFSYSSILKRQYHAPFRHHNIDLIDTPHTLEGYQVLISPFVTTIDAETRARIEAWVRSGGTWIVGPMSDIMTEDTSKFREAPFSFLEELAGVRVKYQLPFDCSEFRAEFTDGTELALSTYFDALEAVNSTPLATYTAGDFKGLAAVTERAVGKGRVILMGSVPSHEGLLRLVDQAPIARASENVDLTERSGERCGIIAVEVENKPGTLVLEGIYRDLIHDRTLTGEVALAPYEVLVLEKAN